MNDNSAFVYVHEPVAPFQKLSGRIGAAGVTKSRGLSIEEAASFTVPVTAIELDWIRVGMCWSIDQSHIGEPVWAGFVAPQVVPLDASEVQIQLLGPKEALLQQPLAAEFPAVVGVGDAVKGALEAAQSQGSPMLEGIFNDSGSAIPLAVRGETISQFVSSMQNISRSDFRVRAEEISRGLEFFLDFGTLENTTNIILRREDIAAAQFTANRIPSTMTAFGASEVFTERERVTLTPNQKALGSAQQVVLQADAGYVRLVTERSIGPAAIRHVNQIDERFNEGFASISSQRHEVLIRQVEEYGITLVNTTNSRRVQLGDVLRVDVKGWIKAKDRVLDVDVEVHVRTITPNDDVSTRDLLVSRRF